MFSHLSPHSKDYCIGFVFMYAIHLPWMLSGKKKLVKCCFSSMPNFQNVALHVEEGQRTRVMFLVPFKNKVHTVSLESVLNANVFANMPHWHSNIYISCHSPFSLAIWTISELKSLPGFSSGGIKSPVREKRGKNGNLWFFGIFSNIGFRPGPILWLRLCPRECFPCQHTSLPVADQSVNCGFRSRHPGSVPVLLLPVLGRKPTSCVVGRPATWAGARIWGPLVWIQREGVKDDSISICPP